MESEVLVIRADASSSVGLGHIMRMIALAQAWIRSGGRVAMVSAFCPKGLSRRIDREGIKRHEIKNMDVGSAEDAKLLADTASELGSDWVVLDGYRFDEDYQKVVIDAGFRLAVIDDNGHQKRYISHLLLNQNCYANALLYPHLHERTRLLLGAKYVLLRQEFLVGGRPEPRGGKEPKRILITLGGADPLGLTGKVLGVLNHSGGCCLEIRIVVGAGFSDNSYEKQVAESPHCVTLVEDPESVAIHLRWADAVVTAAGSTIWECFYMRLPVALCVTVDNQVRVAEALSDLPFVFFLGDARVPGEIDFESGIGLLLRGGGVKDQPEAEIIDGLGAERMVDEMIDWVCE